MIKEHDNLVKTVHAEAKIGTRHFPETPQSESTFSVRKWLDTMAQTVTFLSLSHTHTHTHTHTYIYIYISGWCLVRSLAKTSTILAEMFRGVPPSHETHTRTAPKIKPRLLPTVSNPIHYSLLCNPEVHKTLTPGLRRDYSFTLSPGICGGPV